MCFPVFMMHAIASTVSW